MVVLTTSQRRLLKTASLLGTIQGVVYAALSIICLIEIYKVQTVTVGLKDNFYYTVYYWFFYDEHVTGGIITADSFPIFVWIYLVLDIIWILISLTLVWASQSEEQNPVSSIIFWSLVTIVISIVDLVLITLLGIDYDQNCEKYFINIGFTPEKANLSCTNAMVPILVIIGKGFILWLINILFVIILSKISYSIIKEHKEDKKLFNVGSIPRATLKKSKSSDDDYWSSPKKPDSFLKLPTQTTLKSNGASNKGFWDDVPEVNSPNGSTSSTQDAIFGKDI